MATSAQINANRENAKKSTGPVTDAGILTTSQNAIRHSLCASLALMPNEQPEDAKLLLSALRSEHQPIGVCEEILVHKMAEHLWHQQRANRLLVNQLQSTDRNVETRVTLLLRYQGGADRGYYRALNEIRKVQKERRLAENGSVSPIPEAPPAPSAPPPQKPAPEPEKTAAPAPPAAPVTEKVATAAPPDAKNAA